MEETWLGYGRTGLGTHLALRTWYMQLFTSQLDLPFVIDFEALE